MLLCAEHCPVQPNHHFHTHSTPTTKEVTHCGPVAWRRAANAGTNGTFFTATTGESRRRKSAAKRAERRTIEDEAKCLHKNGNVALSRAGAIAAALRCSLLRQQSELRNSKRRRRKKRSEAPMALSRERAKGANGYITSVVFGRFLSVICSAESIFNTLPSNGADLNALRFIVGRRRIKINKRRAERAEEQKCRPNDELPLVPLDYQLYSPFSITFPSSSLPPYHRSAHENFQH